MAFVLGCAEAGNNRLTRSVLVNRHAVLISLLTQLEIGAAFCKVAQQNKYGLDGNVC